MLKLRLLVSWYGVNTSELQSPASARYVEKPECLTHSKIWT